MLGSLLDTIEWWYSGSGRLHDVVHDELRNASSELVAATDSDQLVLLTKINQHRRRLLGNKRVDPVGRPRDGRILVVQLSQILSDGFAEEDSNDFLDLHNLPICDLWVSLEGTMLICWVPPEHIDAVELAIECNAESSICWGIDSPNDLARAMDTDLRK